MRIEKPSVSLLWVTPEPLKVIERAGRTAYKSEDKITDSSAEAFVRMLVLRGHESVIEHASASLLFVTDRGVSHELVRHRLFSFTQESTRYCNYNQDRFGNEITVIEPPTLGEVGRERWLVAMREAESNYFHLLEQEPPQLARSVLPNSLKTEIVVTGNFREWRHFLRLRTSPAAHPQMQEVARMAQTILAGVAPVVFEDANG